jgi:hypothetical protein
MATSALLADGDGSAPQSDRYRWTALSNTTLGVFMATLDSSIVIISLPAIFRGIHLNPLEPGNIGYLLWILMGYLVVTAVLVVTFGRIGDIFGRVRMYNLGFLIFTLGSIALSLTWSTGAAGASELIVFRIVQGIGGALLWANATAILTDAFPVEQRGMAMGHQPDRRVGRLVHRVGRRRGPRRRALAAGVLDQRALRTVRDRLGVREAARDRAKDRGSDRLVGERDVRRGFGNGPGRHHVRDPAPPVDTRWDGPARSCSR